MIKRNLPLPYNTKLDWHECFAKLLLEKYSSLVIKNLKVIDKPDLQNENLDVGIEVTTAVDPKDKEMEMLYSKLEYGGIKNKNNAISKIEKLGGKIENGILIHPVRHRDFNKIYNCLKNKLAKINYRDYKIFKTNILFISDENIILEQDCNSILEKFNNLSEEYKIKFDYVYLYIYGDKLFEFDLKLNETKIIKIYDVYKISISARELVEQAEIEK